MSWASVTKWQIWLAANYLHSLSLRNTHTYALKAALFSGKLRYTKVTARESDPNTNTGRKFQPKKCSHLLLNPNKGKCYPWGHRADREGALKDAGCTKQQPPTNPCVCKSGPQPYLRILRASPSTPLLLQAPPGRSTTTAAAECQNEDL